MQIYSPELLKQLDTEKQKFEDAMVSFKELKEFKNILEKWFFCFSYMFKSFDVGYSNKAIHHLFYSFSMDNWEKLRIKKINKKKLFHDFCIEAHYISDRYSLDRIFRTHCLFNNIFRSELDKIIQNNCEISIKKQLNEILGGIK